MFKTQPRIIESFTVLVKVCWFSWWLIWRTSWACLGWWWSWSTSPEVTWLTLNNYNLEIRRLTGYGSSITSCTWLSLILSTVETFQEKLKIFPDLCRSAAVTSRVATVQWWPGATLSDHDEHFLTANKKESLNIKILTLGCLFDLSSIDQSCYIVLFDKCWVL